MSGLQFRRTADTKEARSSFFLSAPERRAERDLLALSGPCRSTFESGDVVDELLAGAMANK